jgi:hypothetical protein
MGREHNLFPGFARIGKAHRSVRMGDSCTGARASGSTASNCSAVGKRERRVSMGQIRFMNHSRKGRGGICSTSGMFDKSRFVLSSCIVILRGV